MLFFASEYSWSTALASDVASGQLQLSLGGKPSYERSLFTTPENIHGPGSNCTLKDCIFLLAPVVLRVQLAVVFICRNQHAQTNQPGINLIAPSAVNGSKKQCSASRPRSDHLVKRRDGRSLLGWLYFECLLGLFS